MMKKLLLALIAVLASSVWAVAQNPTLYLVGENFGNWAKDEAYKMTENNGVYTITVDKIAGEFKIFDGNWSNSECIFGASNNDMKTNMKIGTRYTCKKNGDNMKMAKEVSNVTVTFNINTKEFIVYTTLYLRGAWHTVNNLWPADETSKMTMCNGVYTIKGVNLYGEFLIANTDYTYKVSVKNKGEEGGTNKAMALATVFECQEDLNGNMGVSAEQSNPITNATVTYYFEKKLIVITDDTHKLPLYLIGDNFTSEQGNWEKDEKYMMEEKNGIYTITVDNLSGKFKIYNGAWDSADGGIDFGTGNTNMTPGEPYVCYIDGDNMGVGENTIPNATISFDMEKNLVTITKGTAATLRELTSPATSDEVEFTGTLFCEFNYLNDDIENGGITTIYVSDNNDREYKGIKLRYDPASINVDINKCNLNASKFNRGQTLAGVRLKKENDKQWLIVGVTLNDDGLAQITEATKATMDIPRVSSISENDEFKAVQVHGAFTYNTGNSNKIEVNGTVIPVVNTFTRPRDTAETPNTSGGTTPAAMESGAEWIYGTNPVVTVNGENRYVAGIVTYNQDNQLAIDMTAVSETVIAGVETTEIDAEAIVTVYNIQGIVVRRAVKYGEATRDLPAGLYIVAGKKVLVR